MQLLTTPPTRERVGFRTISLTSLLVFGLDFAEGVSISLLPLTLYLFTTNAFVISLILAINPIFGFIAQPLVGVLSDRTWTRVGRRAFYLIIGAPIVALTEIWMPFTTAFWLVVVLVIFMQFFVDVLNGVFLPLWVEMVPPEQRSLVVGINTGSGQLGFIFVLFVGMPWVANFKESHGDQYYGLPLYFATAAVLLIFVVLPAFFLKEKRLDPIKERAPLTPAQYIRDFVGQPMLLKLGIVHFIRAFQRAAIVGFITLYAVKTLLFTESEFGQSWGYMPFISLILAVPIGIMVERFNKQHALILAFVTMIGAAVVGSFTMTPMVLLITAICFGLGDMLMTISHKTLAADFYPQGMIGQLATTMNIFFATGRTCGLIFVGAMIKYVFNNDYSIMWPIACVTAAVGIIVLLGVRDIRHEERIIVPNRV